MKKPPLNIILFIVFPILLISCKEKGKESNPAESFYQIAGKFGLVVPKSSTTAPNFNLRNLEGASISLVDYRGKTVLLFFFTTW